MLNRINAVPQIWWQKIINMYLMKIIKKYCNLILIFIVIFLLWRQSNGNHSNNTINTVSEKITKPTKNYKTLLCINSLFGEVRTLPLQIFIDYYKAVGMDKIIISYDEGIQEVIDELEYDDEQLHLIPLHLPRVANYTSFFGTNVRNGSPRNKQTKKGKCSDEFRTEYNRQQRINQRDAITTCVNHGIKYKYDWLFSFD
eukprot:UN23873